jgi:glutamyl-tRNA synthetase
MQVAGVGCQISGPHHPNPAPDTLLPRVRFAPSPTGYLHVGGARTALFNWLYARHTGGKFLLRIEDTDKQRSTDEHTQVIIDGLDWLGLDWDEEVVFQGARIVRHQEAADRLLAEGKAYLDDGAIRFRMPQGEIAWDDAVHERIAFQGEDLKDFVILRTDRTPIYNLAVVVDDVDMNITHVLRGDDHISNTPKQIALYRALGHEPPVFGHVPMINGMDGKKLSKRHGATAVGDYQHLGILPAAMSNFLALLGWSPGGDREIMTRDEMVQLFSFEGIQKKAAVFDTVKLRWMNSQYISALSAEELAGVVAPSLRDKGIDPVTERERILRVIDYVKARSHTTLELADMVASRLSKEYWFGHFDSKALEAFKKNQSTYLSCLAHAKEALEGLPKEGWQNTQYLEDHLRKSATTWNLSTKDFFQPIRIAVSGSTVSEPVNQLLSGVGPQALERIEILIQDPNKIPSSSAQDFKILGLDQPKQG